MGEVKIQKKEELGIGNGATSARMQKHSLGFRVTFSPTCTTYSYQIMCNFLISVVLLKRYTKPDYIYPLCDLLL